MEFLKLAALICATGILTMVATISLMLALAYNTSYEGTISAIVAALTFTSSVALFIKATEKQNDNEK